jgi:hypothetical protein
MSYCGYEYIELGDAAKSVAASQLLLDDWYKEILAEWQGILNARGVHTCVDRMLFNGFGSQGDGASFTGVIDTPVFMLKHPHLIAAYLAVYAQAISEDCGVYAELKRGTLPYSHEHSVYLDVQDESSTISPELLMEFTREALAVCRNYMRSIYRELEQHYWYLSSDEYMIDLCNANEYRFTQAGNLV